MRTRFKKRWSGAYQEEGVMWMVEAELDQERRGGILADDTGLGKTVQTIALMCALERKRPTLIVTTVSTVGQWRDALIKFGNFSPVLVMPSFKGLLPPDTAAVITTYSAFQVRTPPPCLTATRWGRVVLDEGHAIRNPGTRAANEVSKLKSDHRWVLSATPIQNAARDLQALAEWVGAPPKMNLSEIMSRYVLRRTQQQQANINPRLALPELTTTVERIPFASDVERRLYNLLTDHIAYQVKVTEAKSRNGRSIRNAVMEGILRKRQACVHPQLLLDGVKVDSDGGGRRGAEADAGEEDDDDLEVNPCLVPRGVAAVAAGADAQQRLQSAVRLVREMMLSAKAKAKAKIEEDEDLEDAEDSSEDEYEDSEDEEEEEEEEDDDVNVLTPRQEAKALRMAQGIVDMGARSSKVDYIVERLVEHARKANNKALVFCHFRTEMHLIRERLTEDGVSCLVFDGTLSHSSKEAVLYNFEAGVQVLILQVNCGATGLNLQCANLVVISSPHWNPCIEYQAIGRAYRKGQTSPVTVMRVVVAGSVEEKIVKKQNDKAELISTTVGDADILARLHGDEAESALASIQKANGNPNLDELLELVRGEKRLRQQIKQRQQEAAPLTRQRSQDSEVDPHQESDAEDIISADPEEEEEDADMEEPAADADAAAASAAADAEDAPQEEPAAAPEAPPPPPSAAELDMRSQLDAILGLDGQGEQLQPDAPQRQRSARQKRTRGNAEAESTVVREKRRKAPLKRARGGGGGDKENKKPRRASKAIPSDDDADADADMAMASAMATAGAYADKYAFPPDAPMNAEDDGVEREWF
jgi:SNF2 family DNA or RNA helicase